MFSCLSYSNLGQLLAQPVITSLFLDQSANCSAEPYHSENSEIRGRGGGEVRALPGDLTPAGGTWQQGLISLAHDEIAKLMYNI